MAALEADTWARLPEVVRDGRAFQARADAAVQTAPVLVTNTAAYRAGTTGRFNVTHLVVPASLR